MSVMSLPVLSGWIWSVWFLWSHRRWCSSIRCRQQNCRMAILHFDDILRYLLIKD